MKQLLVCVSYVCLAQAGSAQIVLDRTEILAKDRPEAWAMKLIGSELQMTTPPAGDVRKWSFDFGLDAGWIPSLDEEQRLIGFDGTKEERVNRTPVYVRPRVSIGLPWRVSAGFGYIPPVRIGGVRPNHLTWSVGRPIASGSWWRLGGRLHGQVGELQGDITCDEETVAAGNDPVRNPFGCEEPSNDQVRIRAAGIELGGAFPISRRFEPYLSAGWNYFDNEFQVNARYSGIADHTLLLSSGATVSLVAGAGYRLSERIRANIDAFYAPLHVRRQGARARDDLFNIRLSVFYSLP